MFPLRRAQVPAVQVDVIGAGGDHLAHDRLGDDVARGQVGQRMHAGHEPAARGVHQDRAFAAYRLGDQRLATARVGAEPEHRRVELDELQVGRLRPAAQRERQSVAGGHWRVGGRRVDLPEPAGRQHHGAGVHGPDAVGLTLAEHVQRNAGRPAVRGAQQVDGERMLDHLELGARAGLGEGDQQRARDLRTGRVAASVRDPAAQVTAFPGQRQRTRRLAVELRAKVDEPPDGAGPIGHERAHSSHVTDASPGGQRVLKVLLRRVTRAQRGGNAALRPASRPVVEH